MKPTLIKTVKLHVPSSAVLKIENIGLMEKPAISRDGSLPSTKM